MKKALLMPVICMIFLSCKKNNDRVLWECTNPGFSDSATISNKIIGSWVWTKQLCGDGAGKILFADKNVKVNFNSNTSFTVYENLAILTQGNWSLKIVDTYTWGLHLTSRSEYLYGSILFCNNQVMFNDSYIDGCDNVFVKE